MNISHLITCNAPTCPGMDRGGYQVPDIEITPENIRAILIAEAPPPDPADYYYASSNPSYLQTLVQAFREAGAPVNSMQDILNLGVYVTTAVKCAKTGSFVSPEAIANCSARLEREVALFPNAKAFILGGDIAIKMMNAIWKKQAGKRVIPAGATYKLRKNEYYIGGTRVLPSYTPAGKNLLIEKSKLGMIAEDIRIALSVIQS